MAARDCGISNGLGFSSVYSVGNSAQIGVEEVLQHMDETFDPSTSSRVNLLYMESISKRYKFMLPVTAGFFSKRFFL